MNPSLLYLFGLVITLATSSAVVIYLKAPLQKILIELCGTEERAAFWTSFSNITLTVIPVIFAMQFHPGNLPNTPLAFELADQMKWGLIGIVLSITVLAWVLSRFIPRAPLPNPGRQVGPAAS